MVIVTVIVFFVGQVKCPHHPDQLSERSQASKVTLDCFENLKIVRSQVVPGIGNIFVFKDVFFLVSLSFSSNSGMFSHKLLGQCPYGYNTFQKGASLWNWVKMIILKVCKIGMCHMYMRPFRINDQNIYQADRCRINIVYLIKIWSMSYILVVIVEVSLNHESLSKLWALENIEDRYSQAFS